MILIFSDIIFVYLDNIFFFASLEEHIQHIWRVLQWLLENQLFIKSEKVPESSVQFQGFVVSQRWLEMDPAKTQVGMDWSSSNNRKELQCFLA